jgi:aldose 1-epimerase
VNRLIALSTADASVEIAPAVGGAIAAFRHHGRDVLRATSPAARSRAEVRQFACYPLVPYSNRIAQAELRVGDDTFRLARNFGEHPHSIHGLGWQRAWTIVASDARQALTELDHAPQGDAAAAWPFAFRARQSIALSQHDACAILTLTLSIENRDVRAFPFGLGWHPFFPRNEATELRFAADAIWDTDDTRLPTERRAIAAPARFDVARRIGDVRLDNVFAGWQGEAELAWPDERRRATIAGDRSLGFLVVFVPDDRGYVAVEPVTHMTDAFNRVSRGERDTGTLLLAPGASRCCTMRIVSAPLP